MFYPTTCVRLGYGFRQHCRLADFLGGMVTLARSGPEPLAYFQVRLGRCA